MSFSIKISEEALISCGRHCCICHRFCGSKIELHHILQKKDGGENSFDNCIALCFDCHADVKSYNPKHPKGKKYTDNELIRHRNNWHKKVKDSIGAIPTSTNYIELDKRTFEKLVAFLKSDKIMLFIKQNGFTKGSFSDEIFREIDNFIGECELPEFEFVDSDLESLKSELNKLLIELNSLIGSNTFPAGPGRQVIPSEWEYEQPKRFDKAHEDFQLITQTIWFKYDSLVKLARRKLYSDIN